PIGLARLLGRVLGRGLGRRVGSSERVLTAAAGNADGKEAGKEPSRRRHGWSSPPTTASATARRTSRIALFSRVGCTRLVRSTTKSLRSGSIHREVPVKPVWPNDRADSLSPADESGWGVSQPRARLES